MKEEYETKGIPVEERGCCGRCERHNTIVVLDDADHEVIISDLSPSAIREQYIANPDTAIAKARAEVEKAAEKLDTVLDELV